MPSPSSDLASVQAKVDRAREHLQEFDREVEAFVQTDPYSFPRETQADGLKHTYRIRIERPIPERLSLLAGDGIHNLRSALDHLAWQLVLASGATPTTGTEFPIFWERNGFEKRSGRRVKGMRPDIVEAIEAEQPYNAPAFAKAPKWHPLWIVQDLDIIDKHRQLAMLAAAIPNMGGFPLSVAGAKMHMSGMFNRSLKDGDVVADLYFPTAQPNLGYDLKFTSEVFLLDIPSSSPMPARRAVFEIFHFVAGYLIPKLARFTV